jgi:hypothetical protein
VVKTRPKRKQLATQIVSAVDHCHARQIVHGDIKPANVLLTADINALLADFDNSRDLSKTMIGKTGYAQGSLGFIAPEMKRPGSKPTKASDVYCLGVLLAKIFLGLEPEENGPPKIPADADPTLRDLLRRMTNKQPEERPTTAEVMASTVINQADADPGNVSTPSHWRMTNTINDRVQLVDVTGQLSPVLDKVFTMAGLKVAKVTRVENSKLWREYVRRRDQVRREVTIRGNWHPGDKLPFTTRLQLEGTDDLLTADVAEVFALHGTNAAGAIQVHGFDEKVGNQEINLYGLGVYFAEDARKCAQYPGGRKTVFLSRVVLGHAYNTTKGEFATGTGRIKVNLRPPTVTGRFDTDAGSPSTDDRHHSVIAAPQKGSREPGEEFREFIVYEKSQAYPEYLVELVEQK